MGEALIRGKAGEDGQEGGEEGLRSTAQGPEQVGAKVRRDRRELGGTWREVPGAGLNQVFCTCGGATSSVGPAGPLGPVSP